MYPVHQNMFYAVRNNSEDLIHSPQAYISGAGPFLIKTLQQVSNGLKPNNPLKTITEAVFSSIMPMTAGELKVIREELNVRTKYKNFKEDAIGAASIGETHVCVDDQNSPIAVLKFIKPVSAWLFLCEVDFLLTTVWPRLQKKRQSW